MSRAAATNAIRFAGYHGTSYVRLYVESGLSLRSALAAYRSGAQARSAGVRCNCTDCTATPKDN